MRLCSKWLLVIIWTNLLTPSKSNTPKVMTCWKNWLKMTDDNYLRALERYDSCGKLVNVLMGDVKEKYKKALVDNLQRSSNYFFDHTEMSPAEVIRVLRSANHLMDSWVTAPSQNSDFVLECPPSFECANDDQVEEEVEDESCSTQSLSWYNRSKVMFYAFIALISAQFLLMTYLFYKVCCTDLLTQFPSCSYETTCCCDEDKEWITKVIEDCETYLASKQTEAYPLLVDRPERKSSTICYGTNIGKRRKNDEEILMDLSPMSSPRIGSDSEFEALMNRKSLRKHKKPR